MADHAKDAGLTGGQWALSAVAAVLMLALAGLAFTGMFTAVRAEMVPFFGSLAWIVPAGVDLGIVILILTGILLEWLMMPMPALRLVAAFFMGATMWLNALAAHGQVAGVIGHLSLPVLFVASVEAVRHAVRRRSGLAAGTVREGVPLARWLLAFPSTFALWRRMVLWQVTSYSLALEREQMRRRAIAALRAAHGKDWRDRADSSVVWQLVRGIDVEGAAAVALGGTAPTAGPGQNARQAPGRRPGQKTPAKRVTPRDRWGAYETRHPGASAAEVAAALGTTKRSVNRWREQSVVAEAERAVAE